MFLKYLPMHDVRDTPNWVRSTTLLSQILLFINFFEFVLYRKNYESGIFGEISNENEDFAIHTHINSSLLK